MKSKKYLNLFMYMLLAVLLIAACEEEPDGPPDVVNQAPEISGLNDVTLSPGFETYEIDFANYVTDQEGEIITYQVTNSDESVITISLAGSVLTINEVGPGVSEIGVTASDGHEGHEVNASFSVTVEAIAGADDFTGNAAFMLDFNGFGTGSIFDNPVPGLLVEGWTYGWDNGDFGTFTLEHNDHLMIVNNIDSTWIWVEYSFDGNQDFSGKKLRFDYRFYSEPTLTDSHWEDDESGVDFQIWYTDETWEESGGLTRFSGMGLTYSADWQSVEIPLADFSSLWDLPTDASKIGNIGFEIWGGTSSNPISVRMDNFGIVD